LRCGAETGQAFSKDFESFEFKGETAMSQNSIEKKSTNRRGFVKNMAVGAGGYALAPFQSEQDRKKKTSDGGGLTKIEELEAKVKTLEYKIRTLEDIEAIKKLQRAYGYYLEHWMAEDIIDCFADGPDTELLVAAGRYRGKENLRNFFYHGRKPDGEVRRDPNNEFLHQVMQLSGIVHVAPDGKTAQGRWYGFGANAFGAPNKKVNPGWMNGVYVVDYVKVDDRWRFKKVHWCMIFHAPWGESFVPAERRMDQRIDRPYQRSGPLKPVGPPEETIWPSGFIAPFHFDNPATGRKKLT
jgi:hypothetical protein